MVADISTRRYKGPIEDVLRDRGPSDIVAVHASPPCTEFSRALTTRPRDLEAGSRKVKAAFHISKHVGADFWTVENPVGLMNEQPFMNRLYAKYLNTTWYCRCGFPYWKATNSWSNIPDLDLPVCIAETPCATKSKYGRHLVTAQAGSSKNMSGIGGGERVYGLSSNLVVYVFRRGIAEARR